MKYDLAMKSESMKFAEKWIALEKLYGVRSPRPRSGKRCMFSFTCGSELWTVLHFKLEVQVEPRKLEVANRKGYIKGVGKVKFR